MFNSLRYRLLAWLLLSAMLMAMVIFPANFLYNRNKKSIEKNIEVFTNIQIDFLKDQNAITRFLLHEITNERFFMTGESPYLTEHDAYKYQITEQEKSQTTKSLFYKQELFKNSLDSITGKYDEYCTIVDSIVYRIYERGYRDFGLEGIMVSYAYVLENNNKFPKQSFIGIRLNEREYLNRNDIKYAAQVNILCNNLINDISQSNHYKDDEKKSFISGLKNYNSAFNKIIELDTFLGLRSKTGLKAKLLNSATEVDKMILAGITEAKEINTRQLTTLNLIYILLTIILLAGAVYFSGLLSRYLVSHLEQLTRYISSITNSDFRETFTFDQRNSSKEIKQIYNEFRNMLNELQSREIQRVKAINRLKDSEQKYKDLADLLPQSIYETDELGNLVYVNQAWYKAFNYSEQDLKEGINLIEIINTNYSSVLFSQSKVENTDFYASRKDGSKFPAIVYSENIYKQNQIVGRRGIIIDATLRNKYIESLQAEAQRAITMDKQKSSFLANMSHEIRTPMNSIIGFANLLASDQVPDSQKTEFVNLIQSSSKMLLNLIDDIIDIAKIEAGEIKIKKGVCRPVGIIKEIKASFDEYKAQIGKDHIVIETILPDNNIAFKTDDFRLRQILTNLTSNAVKFTEKGKITLKLIEKSAKLLEFTVEDTGMGMSNDELKNVFERFKRAKTSESKNISGSGLGLAITKNLVELLGGQMWVKSEPEKGSKFTIEFPYIRIPGEIKAENPVSRSEDSYKWLNKTILVAEDDQNSFELIEQILRKTGIHLIHAKNGREAVDAVSLYRNIDIILMDIQMPKLTGYEATKLIKAKYPAIPIIAQTAYAMEGDKERTILAGCNDYITKPLDPESLLAKLNQFLNEISADSENPSGIRKSTSVNIDTNREVKSEKDQN